MITMGENDSRWMLQLVYVRVLGVAFALRVCSRPRCSSRVALLYKGPQVSFAPRFRRDCPPLPRFDDLDLQTSILDASCPRKPTFYPAFRSRCSCRLQSAYLESTLAPMQTATPRPPRASSPRTSTFPMGPSRSISSPPRSSTARFTCFLHVSLSLLFPIANSRHNKSTPTN
ncbi:hypothetical protein NEOLEDRAFT_122045 [Neolentinus lepideus HHB14362 ss-1]|uniref:Uncharacterized protein n=1 Tax=Neolentinus lepideus HHB14362 ss-1 TaxID=1314782 RepID=A0A165MSH6_9AGAM|nr:hypothetical protein NEOLEDRAFT_122045 [Neolentinus lepideus HHB14362 ss-1]